MKPQSLFLLLLAAALTPSMAAQSPQIKEWREEARKSGLEGVFGKDRVRIYKAAWKFTLYRVDDRGTGAPLDGRPELKLIGKGVTPTKDWITKFRAAIGNPRNHNWGVTYKCGFHPGVVVRAASAKQSVDILFCFSCTELAFAEPGQRRGPKQSFAPGRPTFLKLFREAFPKDKVLKALKEEFDPRKH